MAMRMIARHLIIQRHEQSFCHASLQGVRKKSIFCLMPIQSSPLPLSSSIGSPCSRTRSFQPYHYQLPSERLQDRTRHLASCWIATSVKKAYRRSAGLRSTRPLGTYVVTEEAVADQLAGVTTHHSSGSRSIVGSFRLVDEGRSSGVSSAVCDEDHRTRDTSLAVERDSDQPFSRYETEAQLTCKNRCYWRS
jgi:hypothetical protein